LKKEEGAFKLFVAIIFFHHEGNPSVAFDVFLEIIGDLTSGMFPLMGD
jgi:hypothetical protein